MNEPEIDISCKENAKIAQLMGWTDIAFVWLPDYECHIVEGQSPVRKMRMEPPDYHENCSDCFEACEELGQKHAFSLTIYRGGYVATLQIRDGAQVIQAASCEEDTHLALYRVLYDAALQFLGEKG